MSSRGSRDPRTVCISSERSSPSKPRPRGCHVRARVHRVSNPKSCPFPAQISNLNYSGSQIPNLKPPCRPLSLRNVRSPDFVLPCPGPGGPAAAEAKA